MKSRLRPNAIRTGRCTLVAMVLMALSFNAYAFGEQIVALSVSTVEQLSYVAAAIVGLLLLGLVSYAWRLRSLCRRAATVEQLLDDSRGHMNNFHIGILHLASDGKIRYANKVAAYYLGNNPQQLLNSQFVEHFGQDHHSQLLDKCQSKVDVQLQLTSQRQDRELLLGFTPQTQNNSEIACVVSISDVSTYQRDIDLLTKAHNHSNRLLDSSQIGQLIVDTQSDEFTTNSLLARHLNPQGSSSLTGNKKQLLELIHVSDTLHWNQGLSDIQHNGSATFACRFKQPEGIFHAKVFGFLDDQQKIHLTLADHGALAEQKQLRTIAQQHVKGLLSSNPNPAYLLKQNGQIVNCNSAFEKMFQTKLVDIQGKDIHDLDCIPEPLKLLHPALDSGLYNGVSSINTGAAKECELDFADGSHHYVKLKLQSYADNDGKRSGMVGYIEDITPLKLAQQQLQQAQQRFKTILDLAPIAIATIDADDHVIDANAAMLKRLGLSEKELKRAAFYQLFSDPNDSAKAVKILHQTGKLHGFHASLKGKDAALHPSELHIDLLDKETQQFLCWISDNSDEKYQQDKFESLLQHSSMPMAVLAQDGFTQLNPAACHFFNAEHQTELHGLYPYSSQLNKPGANTDQLKEKIEHIKVDGQALSLLWQHQHDGDTLDCQATYVPMYKGTQFDSVLCIWSDLRAIKQADKARMEAINLQQAAQRLAAQQQQLLQTSQDQLATQVRSLEDTKSQLQAAKVDLSEKQSEISDLQQAHENMSANLQKLQSDYGDSRQSLQQSLRSNADLEAQLNQTTARVSGLEKQRNQISDALQYSEKKYQRAQHELKVSEQNAQRLESEHDQQQQKMTSFVDEINQLKHSIQHKDKLLAEVNGQISSLQSQLASSGQTSEKLRNLLINQRKASEQAEHQRRDLQQTCQQVQSELSNKARHIEHLQHEMSKFEEMSKQEKGDMQQQHSLLQQELEAKHQQLQKLTQDLEETKRQSEKEKSDKQRQQHNLETLQKELAEVELRNQQQQQKMAETDAHWQQQQAQLQQELQAKQQRLLETEQIINDGKQQTEAERAEKARQQAIFSQLETELAEMELRSEQQQRQMEENDQQWQERQQQMLAEVKGKQQELQNTQQQLDEKQRLSDNEKFARMEQQQKLEQLKVELSDVELRAQKQRKMMEGSDEQWRQHHAEIELQKKQLQQALQEAKQQNAQIQQQLSGSLSDLKQAESQVEQTRSTEQKLQEELDQARSQADKLEHKLKRQEQQEAKLQQQLQQQQAVLQSSESNINTLEAQQQALTAELQAVQKEYKDSQKNLHAQDDDQSQLTKQLTTLEQQLQESKLQLDSKESALQDAQSKLHSSQQKLAQQEQQLVKAHKEELEQAKQADAAEPTPQKNVPAFAANTLPDDPKVWFDLLPYLQQNPHAGSLQKALNDLMDELQQNIGQMDEAIDKDDGKMIILHAKKLATQARKVNSEPLSDVAARLESDAQQGEVDNLSIFWPSVKTSMLKSLRVIYSHLHA